MLVRHVALVVEKSTVKHTEVSRVAAALQKQVTRDFAPIWEVKATVDPFVRLEDVPLGYWPVIVMDNVQGAAGYVAIEKVRGTLHGRRGTFVLQHNGLMTRGAGQLTITVVPDSGTEELVGLSGKFDIKIDGGKHSYIFEYNISDAG